MKKEDFFEVLGGLDDDLLKEDDTTVRKKTNWKIWGALAACLALVLSVGAFALHRLHGRNIVTEPGTADAAPFVYVNDRLYIQSGDQQGYPEFRDDFVYLGQIVSDVSNSQYGESDGIPKENFQANHPIVGCEVYQFGESIVVKINNAYWLYMKYGGAEVNWDDLLETENEMLDPGYRKQ